MQTKRNKIWVGLFLLIALGAIIFLCLKVTNVKFIDSEQIYRLYAMFDNISSLKARSPIKVGGVVIGRVADISLDSKTYLPCVTMDIQRRYDYIPDTSSLTIHTSGLLGEQYLELYIGFEDEEVGTKILTDGGIIQDTKSAMMLEDLIGQFLYNKNRGDSTDNTGKIESVSPKKPGLRH